MCMYVWLALSSVRIKKILVAAIVVSLVDSCLFVCGVILSAVKSNDNSTFFCMMQVLLFYFQFVCVKNTKKLCKFSQINALSNQNNQIQYRNCIYVCNRNMYLDILHLFFLKIFFQEKLDYHMLIIHSIHENILNNIFKFFSLVHL